jgi:hypothetical protein
VFEPEYTRLLLVKDEKVGLANIAVDLRIVPSRTKSVVLFWLESFVIRHVESGVW